MMPTISILIITYNRVEDTLALLKNLNSQNNLNQFVGEILILNNNSTVPYEPIEDFIASNPEIPFRYLLSGENLGVAGGRNYLIKQAQYPELLVLDDDVVFEDKDAIEKISGLFSKPQFQQNDTAVITLNIYYFETRERQRNALPHKHYDEFKEKDWFFTYYFTGAAHLMKKELFSKTGYYPENFFYGMEEYDLSYRIIEAGYSLAYVNNVKVLHKESPLGRVTTSQKLAMMWYNKCVVAWRYLPKKYFYSTLGMWLFEYLKKTKYNLPGALKNIKKIMTIPNKIPTQKIGDSAIDYLRKTKARLWY